MTTHRPSDAALTGLALDPHARHVPSWMYIQDSGPGLVTFVGSSRIPDTGDAHPLRYGSRRSHQLVVGEIILRPHYAVGTDAVRGQGLGGLVTHGHDFRAFLEHGEVLLDPYGRFPGVPTS
ncbi:hypothetical protein OG393_33980 (plasmid) [Streptomyces sp. NBC_01216]|uniref:hypothetical protein n=1 Tax=Streptomyces sp. NBC_01216 TaxID=2903778 RepID=UPI002E16172F|nr:hypothetical protein OG393_33980 [Streptomyces sp. NBC_01216]